MKKTNLSLYSEPYEYTDKDGKVHKGESFLVLIPKPYDASGEVQKIRLRVDKVSQFRDLQAYLKNQK